MGGIEIMKKCKKNTNGKRLIDPGVNKSKSHVSSRVVETDIVLFVEPIAFEFRKNIALEDSIPIWDIKMTDLQLLYETSRMEEYFDWDYTVYRCLTREMKRRIPWLYPGDGMTFHNYRLVIDVQIIIGYLLTIFVLTGCFTRAHIFSQKITNAARKKFINTGKTFELPKKHFVFGDLTFKTTHTRRKDKVVEWGYHVAPIIRMWNFKRTKLDLYILDPGVDTSPILKDVWLKQITTNPSKDITGFVTCEPMSYSHRTNYCFNPVDDYLDDIALCHNRMWLHK